MVQIWLLIMGTTRRTAKTGYSCVRTVTTSELTHSLLMNRFSSVLSERGFTLTSSPLLTTRALETRVRALVCLFGTGLPLTFQTLLMAIPLLAGATRRKEGTDTPTPPSQTMGSSIPIRLQYPVPRLDGTFQSKPWRRVGVSNPSVLS